MRLWFALPLLLVACSSSSSTTPTTVAAACPVNGTYATTVETLSTTCGASSPAGTPFVDFDFHATDATIEAHESSTVLGKQVGPTTFDPALCQLVTSFSEPLTGDCRATFDSALTLTFNADGFFGTMTTTGCNARQECTSKVRLTGTHK